MRSLKLFDFTMHRFAAKLAFDLLNKSQAANGNCFRPSAFRLNIEPRTLNDRLSDTTSPNAPETFIELRAHFRCLEFPQNVEFSPLLGFNSSRTVWNRLWSVWNGLNGPGLDPRGI